MSQPNKVKNGTFAFLLARNIKYFGTSPTMVDPQEITSMCQMDWCIIPNLATISYFYGSEVLHVCYWHQSSWCSFPMATLVQRSHLANDGVSGILYEKLSVIFSPSVFQCLGKKKSCNTLIVLSTTELPSFLIPGLPTDALHLTDSRGLGSRSWVQKGEKTLCTSFQNDPQSFCTKLILSTFLGTPYISVHLSGW